MSLQKYLSPLARQVFALPPIFWKSDGQEPRIQHFLRAIKALQPPLMIDPNDSETLDWFWPVSSSAYTLKFSVSTRMELLRLQLSKSNDSSYTFHYLKHKIPVLRTVVYGRSKVSEDGKTLVISQMTYLNTEKVLMHKRLLLMLFIVGLVSGNQEKERIREMVVGPAQQSGVYQPL